MNKVTLYIDMDGVVSDFETVFGQRPFNPVLFDEFIEDGKFARLPAIQDGINLVNDLLIWCHAYSANVVFLSSCGNATNARAVYQQKRFWLDNNGFDSIELVCVKHKGFKKCFASPLSILVDDTKSNVIDFISNGGSAFLIDDNVADAFLAIRELMCAAQFTTVYGE